MDSSLPILNGSPDRNLHIPGVISEIRGQRNDARRCALQAVLSFRSAAQSMKDAAASEDIDADVYRACAEHDLDMAFRWLAHAAAHRREMKRQIYFRRTGELLP